MDSLSNEELLAILIRTGTKDVSVLDIAHKINGESNGLANLFNTSYEALLEINGIGPGKAMILSACFELCNRYIGSFYGETGSVSTIDIYNRYAMKMRSKGKESFVLAILNRKREIVHEEFLYVGSEFHVTCQPMEIVRKVILHKGACFYIVHNHPSGDCFPSKDDVELTTRVISVSNRVNVRMLDHIIIGDTGFYSFSEHDKCTQIIPNC